MRRAAPIDLGVLLERLGIKAELRGNSWWAPCPFHNEKTPSWRMRDEPGHSAHGLHHCFGCEEGGSPSYLVQRRLGLETSREAWLWITSGESAPDRQLLQQITIDVKDTTIRSFKLAPGTMLEPGPLSTWPQLVQEYVAKRGIEAWQVERWRLTYAREGRLRGRLVIPVYDAKDKLVSYTGRAWANREKKYLEPRQEEGADQGAIFGEQWWPQFRSQRELVLCEGALNALAVERARNGGFVGALMGSHFDPAHAAKLSTFGAIIVASDPDAAGSKLRAALAGLGRWVHLRHAHFPKGSDACDVEREQGREVLKRVLLSAER